MTQDLWFRLEKLEDWRPVEEWFHDSRSLSPDYEHCTNDACRFVRRLVAEAVSVARTALDRAERAERQYADVDGRLAEIEPRFRAVLAERDRLSRQLNTLREYVDAYVEQGTGPYCPNCGGLGLEPTGHESPEQIDGAMEACRHPCHTTWDSLLEALASLDQTRHAEAVTSKFIGGRIVNRDTQPLRDRFGAVHRYMRQIDRLLADVRKPWAEEHYEDAHEAAKQAEKVLGNMYRELHARATESQSSEEEHSG